MKKPTKAPTQVIETGRGVKHAPGMVNVPVYHASTILFDSVADLRHAEKNRDDVLYYGRRGTPTHWALREALTELEDGAGCVLYGSGLAAITASTLAFVNAGDHILVADTVYEPTRVFCNLALRKLGIETTYFDPMIGGNIAGLMQPDTRAVFLESPGSLTFEVQDLPAIAEAAHAGDAMVLIDNTWATPLYHQPLALGADVSIQSLTKYVVGHSDAMLGAAIANDRAFDRLRRMSFAHGHAAAPDDIYLALRGLRTLETRLTRHAESTRTIIDWLLARPEVDRVLYPALPDHPGHDLWQRDFSGAASLFSIVLKGGSDAAVAAMLDGYTHFGIGFSYGGFESLALPVDPTGNRTATAWHANGPMVRYHIGLEDPGDLITDLDEGFARFNAT